jgi:hypothetical protein
MAVGRDKWLTKIAKIDRTSPQTRLEEMGRIPKDVFCYPAGMCGTADFKRAVAGLMERTFAKVGRGPSVHTPLASHKGASEGGFRQSAVHICGQAPLSKAEHSGGCEQHAAVVLGGMQRW